MDFADRGDHFELVVDVPGLSRDDLDLKLYNDYLVVCGERHLEHEEERDEYLRTERFTGQFARRVPLTPDVDTEGVTAELDNGVLTSRFPRQETATARRSRYISTPCESGLGRGVAVT